MKKIKYILLVDDNKDDQYLFNILINEIDTSIFIDVANNGSEALTRLDSRIRQSPDMIFMDVNMPVMGGVECLERIMKKPETCKIPVIMYSTDLYKAEITKKMGAKAFVNKAWGVTGLLHQITHIINEEYA